jgi:trans-2,3-dihydro-3-hydroxyanthranilate isomerase
MFTHETDARDSDIHSRLFAPALGVDDDPATGCAAVGLARYLAERDPRRSASLRWHIEQGAEIGRPSRLSVKVDKAVGYVSAIRVSAAAVYVGQGEIEVGCDHGTGESHPVTKRGAACDCARAVVPPS